MDNYEKQYRKKTILYRLFSIYLLIVWLAFTTWAYAFTH